MINKLNSEKHPSPFQFCQICKSLMILLKQAAIYTQSGKLN